MVSSPEGVGRIGLGLAAAGRPAYINLGHDVDQSPGLGVEQLRRRCHELLDRAWDLGVRTVDAARSYGLAERFLGSWLAAHAGRREQLLVSSKWGYRYVGGWRVDAEVHERKDHALAAFREQWPMTVAELGGEPDQYLVHSVTPDSPALADAGLLAALQRLADGGVRVGLSTSGPRQAEVVRRALDLPSSPFRVVQSTWNVLETSAGPALAEASDAGWRVMVKEALANGRLTDRGDATGLLDAAAAAGVTPDALALRAVLEQPWATIVLSGASTPAQLASNLGALEVGADAVARLDIVAESPGEYWRHRSTLAWN
ncbi:aldo/keto reductase [Mycetocola reblochoni]|uniref:L-fuco-beta-pyranose dehydrogenase n=2 Tax=Mycetocola reblochoni TaxID=331618 RepID=A0A1R4IVX4_9MICO|nr:aldo/keto reductase [Mycetocola reblochoni]RLP70980.1 aldo/keto reductase [Mycetocola reblochoni]SJN23992.1 L-fuco-beta-pyranose dehydrogenase [Mycetocola reblochoni REB411]